MSPRIAWMLCALYCSQAGASEDVSSLFQVGGDARHRGSWGKRGRQEPRPVHKGPPTDADAPSSLPPPSSALKTGMRQLQEHIKSVNPAQWGSEFKGLASEVLAGLAEDGGFAGLQNHKAAENMMRTLLTANALVSSQWGRKVRQPGTVDSVRALAPDTSKLMGLLSSKPVNDPIGNFMGNYSKNLLRLVLVPTVHAIEEQTGVVVHQISSAIHPDDAMKIARLFQASRDTVTAVWHNMTGQDNEDERALAVERIIDETRKRTKFPSSEAVIDRAIYGRIDQAEHGFEQLVRRSAAKVIKQALLTFKTDQPDLGSLAVESDKIRQQLSKESLIHVPDNVDVETLKDTAAKSDKLVEYLMNSPKRFASQFNTFSPEGLLARRQERQRNAAAEEA